MGIEIVLFMVGCSFGLSVINIIQNYRTKSQVEELLRSTVEKERE